MERTGFPSLAATCAYFPFSALHQLFGLETTGFVETLLGQLHPGRPAGVGHLAAWRVLTSELTAGHALVERGFLFLFQLFGGS